MYKQGGKYMHLFLHTTMTPPSQKGHNENTKKCGVIKAIEAFLSVQGDQDSLTHRATIYTVTGDREYEWWTAINDSL